jgi:hypothetical protein
MCRASQRHANIFPMKADVGISNVIKKKTGQLAGRPSPLRRRRQHTTHIVRLRLIENRLDAVDPTHGLLQPV